MVDAQEQSRSGMAQDHLDGKDSSFRHARAAGASDRARRHSADRREWTETRRTGGPIVGQPGMAGEINDPASVGARVEEAARVPAPQPAGRIALIVDREPLIRDLLRVVLARQGWQVIDASDPDESVAKLDGHRPGLLVIDPTPHDEPDADLVARIRSRDPGASIVVMSDDPVAEGIARQLGARFVPKPFAIRDFAMFVGSLAEDPRPARFTGQTTPPRSEQSSSEGPHSTTTAEALNAWRAAERGLEATLEGSPQRLQLESDVRRCRDDYLRLVDLKTRLSNRRR